VGNSRGIRIPKPVIEQIGLGDEVEMVVREHALIVTPVGRPRAGWGDAFRTMAASGDDRLIDEPRSTRWEDEAWEW
jgi:antitoxin MazE